MADQKEKTAQKGHVMGHRLAAPRLTLWAAGYFALYVALPFLVLMGLLDLALWAVMRFGFDTCYGLLCLTG